jgi:hypothetical protein
MELFTDLLRSSLDACLIRNIKEQRDKSLAKLLGKPFSILPLSDAPKDTKPISGQDFGNAPSDTRRDTRHYDALHKLFLSNRYIHIGVPNLKMTCFVACDLWDADADWFTLSLQLQLLGLRIPKIQAGSRVCRFADQDLPWAGFGCEPNGNVDMITQRQYCNWIRRNQR